MSSDVVGCDPPIVCAKLVAPEGRGCWFGSPSTPFDCVPKPQLVPTPFLDISKWPRPGVFTTHLALRNYFVAGLSLEVCSDFVRAADSYNLGRDRFDWRVGDFLSSQILAAVYTIVHGLSIEE